MGMKLMKKTIAFRWVCSCIVFSFLLTVLVPSPALAQDLNLPAPGTMVLTSPAYTPVIIKGLKVHPENPLLFDFVLDTGTSNLNVGSPQFKTESQKLIKYFLASLTIKEGDQWVNLSPYEKDKIIPEELGTTELGQEMLGQDYILKQLTASLIYPEKDLGKKFWDHVYAKARQLYGSTQIPVNTFNKVWIVADQAKILERNHVAYITGAHLKIMLEEDYTALRKHGRLAGPDMNPHSAASQIVRDIVLPAIEKEVNEGKNFAPLRQIFYSMILAAWYKQTLKNALLNQVYSNKAKTEGVLSDDPQAQEKIYRQYIQAYKKGVFNYIKEDTAQNGQTIPRKYFSGGVAPDLGIESVMAVSHQSAESEHVNAIGDMAMVTVNIDKQMPAAQSINILIADAPANEKTYGALEDSLQSLRKKFPDADIHILKMAGEGTEALKTMIRTYKPAGIFVRSATKMTAELIDYGKDNGLKFVVRGGAGVDNIDTQRAKEKNISVIPTYGNADSVAGVTLTLLSLLSDQGSSSAPESVLPLQWSSIVQTPLKEMVKLINKSKKWGTKDIPVDQARKLEAQLSKVESKESAALAKALNGKTIGMWGFGRVGQAEGEKLQRFQKESGINFNVISSTRAFDQGNALRIEEAGLVNVAPVSLEDLLKKSDVLLINVSGGQGLTLTASQLARHPNVKAVINTAREDVFPLDQARQFINSGGVVLGDFDLSPAWNELSTNFPAQTVLLPHIAASTANAGEGVENETVPIITEIAGQLLGAQPSRDIVIESVNGIPIGYETAGAKVDVPSAEFILQNNVRITNNSAQPVNLGDWKASIEGYLGDHLIRQDGKIVLRNVHLTIDGTGDHKALRVESDAAMTADQFIKQLDNPYLGEMLSRVAAVSGKIDRPDMVNRLSTPQNIFSGWSNVAVNGETRRIFHARVINNTILGPAKGGIRWVLASDLMADKDFLKALNELNQFSPTRNEVEQLISQWIEKEASALALGMTLKDAGSGLELGGGKAAVFIGKIVSKGSNNGLATWTLENYDQEDWNIVDAKIKAAIARQHALELARSGTVGPTRDIPAPDMRTNPQILSWYEDEYLRYLTKETDVIKEKLPELYEKLKGITSTDPTATPYLQTAFGFWKDNHRAVPWLGVFTGKALGGVAGRPEATGYGVVDVMENILPSLSNYSVAVNGFGNVGYYTCERLLQKGAQLKVINDAGITLIKKSGWTLVKFTSDPNSPPGIQDILAVLKENKTTLKDAWEKGLINKQGITAVSDTPEHKNAALDAVLSADVDVIVPAARENLITEDNQHLIKARWIFEGANGPTTVGAEKKLIERHVNVVPDLLTNAGGVTVSSFETQQTNGDHPFTEEEVGARRRASLRKATLAVYEVRKKRPDVSWREAFYIAAINTIGARINGRQLLPDVQYTQAQAGDGRVPSQVEQENPKDHAALAKPGGIDLNAKNLRMDITKQEPDMDLKFDPVTIEQFKRGDFSGVVPVIIRITPISSPLPLLGINSSQKETTIARV